MRGRRRVLLVEDDPDDALMMRHALAEGSALELSAAEDGQEAMDYLRRQGRFAGASRPELVLLDWRLPKKSGEEVLAEIRGEPALRALPVLVLTTSESARDVRVAYELGANAFLTKPTGVAEMKRLLASIEEFWLVHARLPE